MLTKSMRQCLHEEFMKTREQNTALERALREERARSANLAARVAELERRLNALERRVYAPGGYAPGGYAPDHNGRAVTAATYQPRPLWASVRHEDLV
jgi:hypothetical protein